MTRTRHLLWLLPIVFMLLGALPPGNPLDLVRQGNAAFDRGDYSGALGFYDAAEEASTDPGLVAFNKGTALYRLGRYREAEQCYLRCREDASGNRLARLLYDLGNSLVMQALATDIGLLKEAVADYEECLQHAGTDAALAENARHNLGLAKALLMKARAAQADSNSEPPDRNGERRPSQQEDKRGTDTRPPGSEHPAQTPSPGERIAPSPGGADESQKGATPTTQPPPPGVGTLPPIPDNDQLVPMSPEDTQAYLEQAAARILRERAEQRQRLASSRGRAVKDW